MRERSAPQIAALFACACVLILLLRLLTVWQFPEHIADNYVWTHTRLDSILFGSILAMYQNPMLDAEAWRPRPWHVAGASLLIILTFAIRSEVFRQTLRYTFQGAALFVLFSFVLSGGSRNLNRLLSSKPLVWIGLLSYTLYLCHLGIDAALKAQLGMSPLVAGILGFPLALLYAQLMRWLVEVPILNWRRRHGASVKGIAVQPITVSEASLDPVPAAVPSK
jgi:peptidoglycan/LPS O-acetylase OafA/YrhL